ncbi:hypothetical protein N9219_04780 [bacterium]|nr:hypothetical protein [bacterium]
MKLIKNLFFIILAFITIVSYAWGFSSVRKHWNSEGIPITTALGHQLRSASTSDGAIGAIIVWEDHRVSHGIPDIYGQRVNANGVSLWEENGAPLITALNVYGELAMQTNPMIDSDSNGGAVFVWEDDRNLQGDIFAQRVNGNGVDQWQINGVPISTACFPSGICTNYKHNPQIISDGDRGAIITWYEIRDGFHFSVWGQRVSANGATAWTLDGGPVAYGSFNADFPKIVTDGMGGAIIAWQDGRDGYKIFAQRLNADGTPQWISNGIELSPAIGLRGLGGHSLISDGSGGAIIVWVDRRTINDANIYAQKIDSNGQIQWQADGVPICTRPMEQYLPVLSTDGAGGAIITWEDQGASPPGSGQQWIFAQRISASGVPLWNIDGIPIHTFHGFTPQIASDGNQGAFIVWNSTIIVDPYFHKPSVFAQHVNAEGRTLWTPDGFVVYSEPYGNYGHAPNVISDGAGGVIIHWKDYRHTNTFYDIYAQRIKEIKGIPCLQLLLLNN